MNMFLHELRAYRKSTIIWSFSLVAIAVLMLSMFPSFSKDAADFNKLIEGYPEAVRKAIGLSIDSATSLLGFYSFVFGYILLCGSIQAMNLGTSIISKEIREKTADFLLTKPVTRGQIVTSKLLAVITSFAITNVIYLVAASFMVSSLKTEVFDFKIFFMISITVFFNQLMFMSLGVLVSVIVPKIKTVLPVSLGTVFSFFIIGMISSTTNDSSLRYITPFKYFDPPYIIKNSSYETRFIIIGLIFIIAATFMSYLIYSKKDVHSV